MISRMTFCSAHAEVTKARRFGPMPSSSVSRCGACSMTSNTSTPKALTSFLAKCGPMPLTMPEPRYFSIPSKVEGCTTLSWEALNCSPWERSLIQFPRHSTYSPAVTDAAEPMTVDRSRWPRTLTRSTQNPLASL